MIPVMWHLGADDLGGTVIALSAIVCWHVRRGDMITVRLGDVEMIIRRWRRRL